MEGRGILPESADPTRTIVLVKLSQIPVTTGAGIETEDHGLVQTPMTEEEDAVAIAARPLAVRNEEVVIKRTKKENTVPRIRTEKRKSIRKADIGLLRILIHDLFTLSV